MSERSTRLDFDAHPPAFDILPCADQLPDQVRGQRAALSSGNGLVAEHERGREVPVAGCEEAQVALAEQQFEGPPQRSTVVLPLFDDRTRHVGPQFIPVLASDLERLREQLRSRLGSPVQEDALRHWSCSAAALWRAAQRHAPSAAGTRISCQTDASA